MSTLKGLGDHFFSSVKNKLELSQMKPKIGREAQVAKNRPIGALAESTAAERAEKSATEFESLLVQQMIQSMWKSVPKNGMLTGGYEEEMYQEMLQKEMATHIATHQSIGVKDIVLKEMLGKKGE